MAAKKKAGKTKKTKPPKRVPSRIPQDMGEVLHLCNRMGALKREAQGVDDWLNGRVDKLKEQAAEKLAPLMAEIQELLDGVFMFASVHQDELTRDGDKRSFKVADHEVGWRTTPPAVTIRGKDAVIEAVRAIEELAELFLRTRVELDKESMLKHPAKAQAISGVSISQKELFFVKLAEVEADVEVDAKKLRKDLGVKE